MGRVRFRGRDWVKSIFLDRNMSCLAKSWRPKWDTTANATKCAKV